MAKIKRDLKKKPILEKTSTGKTILLACNGNGALGDIAASLADFTAANAALHQALKDVDVARLKALEMKAVQDRTEAEWNEKFELLCAAIESETSGNATKILSAGLSIYVRGHKPELGTLPAPERFVAKAGVFEGEVRLRWSMVPGRVAFVFQMAEAREGEQVWQDAGVATKCKASIKKLVPGRQYWFRVAALGTAGRGPWSGLELCRAA